MTPSKNSLIMLVDIFRSPTQCFAALYQKGIWGWQPFIVLLISPFLFWGAYFDVVDFEWLKSQLIATMTIPEDQQALINSNTLLAGEVILDVAGRIFAVLLLGFWFTLATKQSQYKMGYWKWVAASCVMLFPAVLGDLASYISLLVNHGQIVSYAADLNSLNGLIKLSPDHSWYFFTSSFPLLLPWYIVLGYAALGAWTEFEKGQALAIAILPWLLFYSMLVGLALFN
ncbi:conserved hypothetical protein [Vibrio nigripulchritudo MADA3029]|uniref:YIP1 family protein n=1 Tax=Vibrio nigripulchritudo TaxID=28173 RepID=UPI00021C26DE|nr:YIP1 family protein [Vibrio nigripulchritudo]EGU55450.1 hypothetical protein VINI7043_05461 [Vibrio nigripulchritudo ATCC 27043]KJY69012.1 membrane protein [Vibrio nigripulchritudo]CCN32852.1 conserved hypothetical protein [Vibrio nigripulchritudo AM115]CCN40933.1 conserved hypothetical protein [Vibrio nigripulchritudo FTn2]CCN48396.1 conserved hypothetical protein [Vibrio nigripulchritudo MADA3020]